MAPKKVKKVKFVVRKIIRSKGVKKPATGLPRITEVSNTVVAAEIVPNKALMTLEDRHLQAILADPRYTQACPCLGQGQSELKKVGKKCGRCNRKRARMRSSVFKDVRACLVRMDKTQQQAFKALIGAKQVQLMVVAGKTVKTVTF